MLLVFGPSLALLALVVAAAQVTGQPIARFTLDPAALFGFHPTTGILSYLGILGWTIGAVCAAFGSRILYLQDRLPELRRFLALSAALTTVLALDDLFMIHEWFFVDIIPIGQKTVLVTYAVLTGGLLFMHRALILRSIRRPFLGLALIGFATSVAVDLMPNGVLPYQYFLEDGPKFLGIVGWASYFAMTALEAIVASD